MKPIVIDFGGYQPPASVHNRAAAGFGELLRKELGDRISFHLTGHFFGATLLICNDRQFRT